MTEYEIYLAHHGILGQRWGVRRYQNKDGSLTSAGKKRYADSGKNINNKSIENLINANRDTSISSLKAGGPFEVYIASYAIAAAYLGISAYINSEGRQRKLCNKELDKLKDERECKSFDDVPKLKKPMSPEENMKVTNPDYPSKGTTMNCTFCTTAMAMREKGYDVKAAKINNKGFYTDDFFMKTFGAESVTLQNAHNENDIIKALSAHGDGSYGNISVRWIFGSGHSMFWKNENGNVRIFDGQDGTEMTGAEDRENFFSAIIPEATSYARLDNCEPTEYALGVTQKK